MKPSILTVLITVFCCTALVSQPVKRVENLKEEEVPVAVRIAFVNDFGGIPEGGTWTVNFTVVNENGKSMAKPIWYTFRKGNKHEKIEVRYAPDGKLDLAKGLKKVGDNS